MQVGFSPVNIKSPAMNRPQRQQNTNFGHKIDVSHAVARTERFPGMIERGVHEDSPENRTLLKEVIRKLKKQGDEKWDMQDIKEAIFKTWGKDDELKDMFKGY